MQPDDSRGRTSYDAVPYESYPFSQTHPERLAALGRLFALEPPELATCRVLELGCASGGNLIPMALSMPTAEFVGVDLSQVQVAQGERAIADLGLTNIRLLARDIAAIDESFGRFDYIIAHGVYSWVPSEVQEKMLALCAGQLTPNGIAYVSYNTLPGWRMRGMVRDAMRFHATQFDDPADRVAQARGILDFLARWVPADNNPYGMLLKSELDGLKNAADSYILHEHLEDINEPVYFHEFAERAGRHGLQYLAESELSTMLAANLPEEVSQTLAEIATDVIRQEQLMDFLRNRAFRQTLLVRKDQRINRTLTPERVTSLWISAALVPANAEPELHSQRMESFQGARGGVMTTSNPVTKAAMVALAKRWPEALSFAELQTEALRLLSPSGGVSPEVQASAPTVLSSDILRCAVVGLLELHAGPAGFVRYPGERPLASPLARWQAARSMPFVTTLRHEVIRIGDQIGPFLGLLDGSRDRSAIGREFAGLSQSAGGPANAGNRDDPDQVDRILDAMARSALLMA